MSLLIEEPPLQVLPSLAKSIGLNEAIVLQQIHYWIRKSNNLKDGHKWIYNSMPNWQKQFNFWSLPTVKRVFRSLEKQGLIITANYNKAGFDKTKWYRINYEKLQHVIRRWYQIGPTDRIKMIRPIPIDYQRLLQRLLQTIIKVRHSLTTPPIKKFLTTLIARSVLAIEQVARQLNA